jgi:hypothetical protein
MEITRKVEGQLSRKAVQVLIANIKKFDTRKSGYARVIKLSPRKSDSARMAILELVDFVKESNVAKKTDEKKTSAQSKKKEVK